MLSLSFRPKYLPREFGQAFVTTVYIPPDVNVARAASEVADVVLSLRLLSPDAPNFVLDDVNSCDLQPFLPTFQQFPTCTTRKNKTLDKCYGKIPNAYRSAQKAPIGTSDHNAVHLIPSYRQKLKTGKIVSKEVCAWSGDVAKQLQGCFECTDWEMFFHSNNNIHEVTAVITDYIKFCSENVVPKKTIKIVLNNKPWVTRSLKKTEWKKIAFCTHKMISKANSNKT